MLKRVQTFIENYGPVVQDGFRFEGAYTDLIIEGDGDFLTQDTIWVLKVIKSKPNAKQTLQVLIYYLIGEASTNPNFKMINKIGIFNPRLYQAYILKPENLASETFNEVSLYVSDIMSKKHLRLS